MTFTEISTNDYPLFHDLLNDYYREGEDEGTEQEVIDSFIKLLFDKVTGREIDGCIVKENGEALGFALWAVDREGFDFSEIPGYGTVLEIGIVKQYRNRRYGVKLMSHIEDKLFEKGITDCYVSAYGPAQEFWSRCGFEDSGRTAGNGLPIMIKSIKKPENSRCIVRQATTEI
ncbi:MAG: GNAT family N-acetyltransferase [Lachnospiraceae bacterium]|nr:GNAT family N-acetyltransferase [Lachnospiraceae bacterium]